VRRIDADGLVVVRGAERSAARPARALTPDPDERGLRLERVLLAVKAQATGPALDWIAPRLADRFGTNRIAALGLLSIAAGLVVISLLDVRLDQVTFYCGLALFGVGMGLAGTPATTAITASLPESKQGVASAVLTLMKSRPRKTEETCGIFSRRRTSLEPLACPALSNWRPEPKRSARTTRPSGRNLSESGFGVLSIFTKSARAPRGARSGGEGDKEEEGEEEGRGRRRAGAANEASDESVQALLSKTGDWQKFKGEPAPPPLLEKPVKRGRRELFDEALAASHSELRSEAVTAKKAAAKTAEPKAETTTAQPRARKAVEQSGKSLLPVGVLAVEGAFGKGEVVSLCDADGVDPPPPALSLWRAASA
jgi:hypothetical protein